MTSFENVEVLGSGFSATWLVRMMSIPFSRATASMAA